MNKFFSTSPIWQQNGLFLIRVMIGFFLIYHGKEVFDAAKMQEYVKWDTFKSSSAMPYLGKVTELVAGVLLLLGLFTRLACLITIGTFGYITFFVGKGKFWMEDQHPFLFVLLALLFIFMGPGALSLDELFFKNKKRSY
jgi:putative oxidoreductase